MNANQKLLTYFASKHEKPSVTVLMKLCYLTDLVSIKRGGQQITEYKYERYTFGPFDKTIYQDLESLVEQEILDIELFYPEGAFSELVLYRPNEESDELESIDLSDEQKGIVDEILSSLGGYGARALTDVAYGTKPMLELNATLGGNENIGKRLDLHTR